MDVHVAVGAKDAGTLSRVLSTAAGLTEGILWTKIVGVSDAFSCGAGVCAVALVRTAMEPTSLCDWLEAAGREAAPSDAAFRVDVLLAEDSEQHGEIEVPSPLIALGDPVVTPLLDLDPDALMPDGRFVSVVAAGHATLERVGPVPGFERIEQRPAPTESAAADTILWDDAFTWTAGADEWVPVTLGWGWHKDIEIKLCLLLDAGIPACLHDRPFAEKFGWLWGQVVPTTILVAPDRLDDARRLLTAPVPDEDGAFAAAGVELEAERSLPPYRLLRTGLWVYVVWAIGTYAAVWPGLVGVIAIILAAALL